MEITFVCSGASGDITASIPTVLALCKEQGAKARFLLRPGIPTSYAAARGPHPQGNVLLSEPFARRWFPLLQSQPWCAEVALYDGQTVDYDLDDFRRCGINTQRGHIPRYFFYAFHTTWDLSQPWLFVEPDKTYEGRVLVNRTARYRNPKADYSILRDKGVVFVGTRGEFEDFHRVVPDAEHFEAPDFLALARVIKASRILIGNQSFAFMLAEAMKTPRVLEACPWCSNVVPEGSDAWDWHHQPHFEKIVQELL